MSHENITSPQLRDPDNFKAFHISLEGPADAGRVPELIGSFATPVDEEHAMVSRQALDDLAGARAEDPAWLASLEDMVAYAASKGWVDEEGAIRAHIEWGPGE